MGRLTFELESLMNQKQTVSKLFSPKSSGIFGVAGEFCCLSLHWSQISKDL
jgi:hypothetical protein